MATQGLEAGPHAERVAISGPAPGEESSFAAACERATRLLAMREHSAVELAQKLTRGGVPPALARQAVEALAARNLQSDARFAEGFVRTRVARGYGPLWLRQALRERGVDNALAQALLEQPTAWWAKQAQAIRVRKFGEPPPADRRIWQRQARFLTQRGFSTDLVRQALGRQP
jgi:regulatory protein